VYLLARRLVASRDGQSKRISSVGTTATKGAKSAEQTMTGRVCKARTISASGRAKRAKTCARKRGRGQSEWLGCEAFGSHLGLAADCLKEIEQQPDVSASTDSTHKLAPAWAIADRQLPDSADYTLRGACLRLDETASYRRPGTVCPAKPLRRIPMGVRPTSCFGCDETFNIVEASSSTAHTVSVTTRPLERSVHYVLR
jgi:hypothetical protein